MSNRREDRQLKPPDTPGLPTEPPPELALASQFDQIRVQQQSFIEAEIEYLRELAVLNRTADALATRRTFDEVMRDAAREVAAVTRAQSVWIVEPDAALRPVAVHSHEGRAASIAHLPLEARDLFDRIVQERPIDPLVMPHYDPAAPQDAHFIGYAIISGRHLLGALIAYGRRDQELSERHCTRLLQSLLRQTAVAAENARLFQAMGTMIVDVVIAMAMAIESRDPYTGGHVERVTAYAVMLGQTLGMDEQALTQLRLGGLLHDIGKVAVPDAILRKPGQLTDDEFNTMKTHAAVGHQIISPIPHLSPIDSVVRHHHERYDGKGYPDGLRGQEIPLLARVAAIADAFDAMTSDRPYRKALSLDAALQQIRANAGTQFDPDLAQQFASNEPARFTEAVVNLRQWRDSQQKPDSLMLMDLLRMNLPRVA
jgi:HD-GYP domain-containing protein (c-di-GMP phosphodiesterase class II)